MSVCKNKNEWRGGGHVFSARVRHIWVFTSNPNSWSADVGAKQNTCKTELFLIYDWWIHGICWKLENWINPVDHASGTSQMLGRERETRDDFACWSPFGAGLHFREGYVCFRSFELCRLECKTLGKTSRVAVGFIWVQSCLTRKFYSYFHLFHNATVLPSQKKAVSHTEPRDFCLCNTTSEKLTRF